MLHSKKLKEQSASFSNVEWNYFLKNICLSLWTRLLGYIILMGRAVLWNYTGGQIGLWNFCTRTMYKPQAQKVPCTTFRIVFWIFHSSERVCLPWFKSASSLDQLLHPVNVLYTWAQSGQRTLMFRKSHVLANEAFCADVSHLC